jgi:phosphohistidine phosphatase SixA
MIAIPLLLGLLAASQAELVPADTQDVDGACAGGMAVLVRHGEKHITGNAEADRDAPLSDKGRARAEALALALRDAGIDAVYASQYRRTQETAAPLGAALGLKTEVVSAGDGLAGELAQRIRKGHCGQEVLVAGHSNTLPELMTALGVPKAPPIGDESYDRLFVVHWGPGPAQVVVLRFGAETP